MSSVAVIVPCYNEASRLDGDAFVGYAVTRPDVSFVFVNDGSADDTLAVLTRLAGAMPRARVIDQQPNGGKAMAVWRGLNEALAADTADQVAYWDADLATPLDDIDLMHTILDERPDVDVVLGSRVQLLGREIRRSSARHYLGRVFATCASGVLRLPVYDTQCGAKMFRVNDSLRAALREPFTTGWVFDVELLRRLIITRQASGATPVSMCTVEVPLRRWHDVKGSKVRPQDFPRALAALARIQAAYGTRGFE